MLDAERQKICGEMRGQTLQVDLKTKGAPIASLQVTEAARSSVPHLKLGWAGAPAAPLRFGDG
jgi:hypothetical protein